MESISQQFRIVGVEEKQGVLWRPQRRLSSHCARVWRWSIAYRCMIAHNPAEVELKYAVLSPLQRLHCQPRNRLKGTRDRLISSVMSDALVQDYVVPNSLEILGLPEVGKMTTIPDKGVTRWMKVVKDDTQQEYLG